MTLMAPPVLPPCTSPPHWWVVASPNGPVHAGLCKKCGATYDFPASPDVLNPRDMGLTPKKPHTRVFARHEDPGR